MCVVIWWFNNGWESRVPEEEADWERDKAVNTLRIKCPHGPVLALSVILTHFPSNINWHGADLNYTLSHSSQCQTCFTMTVRWEETIKLLFNLAIVSFMTCHALVAHVSSWLGSFLRNFSGFEKNCGIFDGYIRCWIVHVSCQCLFALSVYLPGVI